MQIFGIKMDQNFGKRGIKMGPLSISEQYISIQTKVDPPFRDIWFNLRGWTKRLCL